MTTSIFSVGRTSEIPAAERQKNRLASLSTSVSPLPRLTGPSGFPSQDFIDNFSDHLRARYFQVDPEISVVSLHCSSAFKGSVEFPSRT